MIKMDVNNLGIPGNGSSYHHINEKQNLRKEFDKTKEFLGQVLADKIRMSAPELVSKDGKLQFINYGDTQLVYVFSTNGRNYVLLVGQPGAEYGIVNNEFNNLKKLTNKDDNSKYIVEPLYYFSDEERELYIAPYIHQARCIASQDEGWGIYIPEPRYRFELFTNEVRRIVNISIIALLIKMFNIEDNYGIASCKIGGGDFILEKEWSSSDKSLESTIDKMKLIAARELLSISFKDYQNLIRKEFVKYTYYRTEMDRDKSILINHKSRVPMSEEEIETGIQLGIILKKV